LCLQRPKPNRPCPSPFAWRISVSLLSEATRICEPALDLRVALPSFLPIRLCGPCPLHSLERLFLGLSAREAVVRRLDRLWILFALEWEVGRAGGLRGDQLAPFQRILYRLPGVKQERRTRTVWGRSRRQEHGFRKKLQRLVKTAGKARIVDGEDLVAIGEEVTSKLAPIILG